MVAVTLWKILYLCSNPVYYASEYTHGIGLWKILYLYGYTVQASPTPTDFPWILSNILLCVCVGVSPEQGEAYADMVHLRRQQRLKDNKSNLAGVFIPSSVPKKSCGVGGHYGTLGGRIDAFSAATKPRDKFDPPKKNILINPSKKGTGYG